MVYKKYITIKNILIFIFLIFFLYLYIKFLIIKNYWADIKDGKNVGNRIIGNISNSFFSFKPSIDLWNPLSKKWGENSTKYSIFWREKIPDIEKILKNQDIKPDKSFSNKAVIHFRCSDVPFCKHPDYTLLPKEYYYFVADKLNQNNIEEIFFINCTGHRKEKKFAEDKCNEYINIISTWLKEKSNIKINNKKICVNIKETYSIMLGCKILVNTGGSFSFIPGLTKGKNYISPSNTNSCKDKKILEKFKNLNKEVHWTMWDKFDNIPHDNLDYETFDYKTYTSKNHVFRY